jgi:hypothetical protein
LLLAPSALLVAGVDFNAHININVPVPAAPAPEPAPQDAAPDQGPPPADDANVVPQMPPQEQQDYALGVSDYYQKPPETIWAYEDQGIRPDELPVVFHLANAAAVNPDQVVSLRIQGLSWQEVAVTLGLSPAVFYWNDVFAVDLGGRYSGMYFRFHHYPRQRWVWDNFAMGDDDIIDLVNLRFTSVYWHRPYREIVHDRGLGRPFFQIGFNYNRRFGAPYYQHHDHAWGGGYQNHYQSHVAAVRSGQWHNPNKRGPIGNGHNAAQRQPGNGAQARMNGRPGAGNPVRRGNAVNAQHGGGNANGRPRANDRNAHANHAPAKPAAHGNARPEPKREKTHEGH